MVFFPLHPAILKPNFDLPLAEVEQVCHLHSAWSAQVAVEVELLLELQELGVSVRGPQPSGRPATAVRELGRSWKEFNTQGIIDNTANYIQ